jgi:hypothetical protein
MRTRQRGGQDVGCDKGKFTALVQVSEIEGPISAWQPIPVTILSDILVDGVRTFAGLY